MGGSGAVDAFLPHDKVASGGGPSELPEPTSPSLSASRDASKEPSSINGSKEIDPDAPQIPPPTAYLLQFALVSLRRLEVGLDDEGIRKHLGRRFAPHVPLQRICVIHVSSAAVN